MGDSALGSPYYWVRYYIRDPKTGQKKRIYESSGSTNRRAAAKFRAARIAEADQGKRPPDDVDGFMSDDLVEVYRKDFIRKGNVSWDRVERAVKRMRPWFGEDRATDITAKRLLGYLDYRLGEGNALAYAQYDLKCLHRMFRLAVHAEHLPTMPTFPEFEEPKNARQGFFTEADMLALQVELPDYLRGVFTFMYWVGWRSWSEVITRRWDRHVDFDEGTVRVLRGEMKNRKQTKAVLLKHLPEIKEIIRWQREYTDHWERELGRKIPWVFHRCGNRIKHYYYAWHSACRRAGLQFTDAEGRACRPRPHDFRRTTGPSSAWAYRAVWPRRSWVTRRTRCTTATRSVQRVTYLKRLRNCRRSSDRRRRRRRSGSRKSEQGGTFWGH